MGIKTILRSSVARALFLAGVTSPQVRAYDRLSIVTFHRVLPAHYRDVYPYPGLVVTPEELDALLGYFVTNFDCGPLGAQHERFLDGARGSRPLLALTFDDGQHDNFLYASKVLGRYDVRASFFIPVQAVEREELLWHDRLGFSLVSLLESGDDGRSCLADILADFGLEPGTDVGSIAQSCKSMPLGARLQFVLAMEQAAGGVRPPDYARLMTFEEIGELAAFGHEIGSHSMTHCLMPECDDISLEYEVRESKRLLEARLHTAVETFCYPNGNSDTRTANAVREAGYRLAVTTEWGANSPNSDPLRLRRFDIDTRHVKVRQGRISTALLAFRMSGLYPGL